ncbi:phage tail tape measure protein [Yersinia rochesterensis]|uniref:phage tail tape measure protein n=1 Tax=Yersinia rochesterensis TaxID=1604335 RepID=UPI00119EEC15|nr:phage tail tape measure protein [Yersinia rochesterensis]
MADIATIALRADTSSLEQGDKALDHFGQTAEKTIKQADGLNDAFKAGAQSQKQNNESLKQQQQELQALLTKINPVTAAFSKLDEMESQLAKFKSKDLVDSETFSQASKTIQQTRDELARIAEARTEEGQTAIAQAAADKKATEAKEAFLTKLRDQNSLYKASASDSATYRAAQLGITSEAAPMIAAIRQQEEATRRDAEQKKLAAIAARGLKDSIKQLEAEERAAAQATKAQEAADKAATDAKENFLRKIKEQVITQNMSKQELLQYKATQLGVSSSADVYIKKINESSEAVHSFSLKSAGARRELGVMLGELARGNLGALRGSSITLANRSGLIDQLFSLKGAAIAGGIGLATAALVGLYKAYSQGEAEGVAFNKQLALTGGYAGKTAAQLSEMSKGMVTASITQSDAAYALAKVVGSGSFKTDQLEAVTKAAVAMQDATGQSVDETIKNFQRLYSDPTSASLALNEQLHYLTAAQYQYISSLERRGDKELAGKYAAELYSKNQQEVANKVTASIGLIEKAAKAGSKYLKIFWDVALDVGRTASESERLNEINDYIAAKEKEAQVSGKMPKIVAERIAQLQVEKKNLEFVTSSQNGYVNAQNKIREANEKRIKGLQVSDEYEDRLATKSQKRTKELTKLWRDVAENPDLYSESRRKDLVDEINARNKDRKEPKQAAYHDDAATKALLDSQARVAALREQAAVTLAMTDQEKQLAKFTQQIADLKSKTILTADQKSLLARSGEITASMQLEAQLSRENVERKKATEALKKMEEYTASIAAKNKQNQDRFGLTSKQAGRVDQEAQLDNTFRKDTKGINDAEQLTKITAEYNKAKAELHAGFEQEDLNEGDWLAGMTQGLEQYGETANNVFSATAQLAQTTMGSMTSMATQMMTTGSANVKQFATNFMTSIVDIINKLMAAKLIQASMGWIGAGASGGNDPGAVPMGLHYNGGYVPEFAGGGYTGNGGKFEPKGVVHGGEFVFTKEATNRIGIDNLYKMMRGYADGGVVNNPVTASAPMLGMQGGGSTVSVDLSGMTIITQGNQQQDTGANNGELVSKAARNEVIAIVTQQLDRAMGQSGRITNFVTNRAGR